MGFINHVITGGANGMAGSPRLVPMDCPLYDEYTTVRRSISLLPDEVHKIQADPLVDEHG